MTENRLPYYVQPRVLAFRKKPVKPVEKLSTWLMFAFVIAQLAMTVYIVQFHAEPERAINCELSEFHPDFTPEMKEQCRMLRSGRLL